eukprot:6229838-Alexandrium_andersonii.AAC.1
MSAEMQEGVCEKTREEVDVEKGWLRGPYDDDALREQLGPRWIPVRRFGVLKGSGDKQKLRVVDDASEYMVNSAVGQCEKVDLGGVGELACICRFWMCLVAEPFFPDLRRS